MGTPLPETEREIEAYIQHCINEGDHELLAHLFTDSPSQTEVLQVLLTTTYPNIEGYYKHEEDCIEDAKELLGLSVNNLNPIHVAALLGEEDIVLTMLEFVVTITNEIEAKKVLFEFLGRIWGDGNTLLHLASFYAMAPVVKRMLELGANANRRNDRGYRPVDCAADDETRRAFLTAEIFQPTPNPLKTLSSTISSDGDSSPPRLRSFSETKAGEIKTLLEQIQKETTTQEESNNVKSTSPKRNITADSIQMPSVPTSPPKLDTSRKTISYSDKISGHTKALSASAATSDYRSALGTITAIENSGTASYDQKAKSLDELRDNSGLSRSGSSFSNGKMKSSTGKKKGVRFDARTMLFEICQFGDSEDAEKLPILKRILGLPEDVSLLKDPSFKPALSINETLTPHQSLTPLHLACTYGHSAIVKLFLELPFPHSANVNVMDVEGWTPLHCASAEGHVHIVKLLGQCRGRTDENGRQEWCGEGEKPTSGEWFYPSDGPLAVGALNDDNESAMEVVSNDVKGLMVKKSLQDLAKLIPPHESHQHLLQPRYYGEEEGEAEEEAIADTPNAVAEQVPVPIVEESKVETVVDKVVEKKTNPGPLSTESPSPLPAVPVSASSPLPVSASPQQKPSVVLVTAPISERVVPSLKSLASSSVKEKTAIVHSEPRRASLSISSQLPPAVPPKPSALTRSPSKGSGFTGTLSPRASISTATPPTSTTPTTTTTTASSPTSTQASPITAQPSTTSAPSSPKPSHSQLTPRGPSPVRSLISQFSTSSTSTSPQPPRVHNTRGRRRNTNFSSTSSSPEKETMDGSKLSSAASSARSSPFYTPSTSPTKGLVEKEGFKTPPAESGSPNKTTVPAESAKSSSETVTNESSATGSNSVSTSNSESGMNQLYPRFPKAGIPKKISDTLSTPPTSISIPGVEEAVGSGLESNGKDESEAWRQGQKTSHSVVEGLRAKWASQIQQRAMEVEKSLSRTSSFSSTSNGAGVVAPTSNPKIITNANNVDTDKKNEKVDDKEKEKTGVDAVFVSTSSPLLSNTQRQKRKSSFGSAASSPFSAIMANANDVPSIESITRKLSMAGMTDGATPIVKLQTVTIQTVHKETS